MTITHYAIQCDGNHQDDKPDYYPLTVTEICDLLNAALVSWKQGKQNAERTVQVSETQVRLCQGIPGTTYPKPDDGDVNDRLVDLEYAYVTWIEDPQTLLLESVKPTDEIVARLCGLMGIQELI